MGDVIPNDFERMLVAILIGALIGLDRERSEIRKAHQLFAGIRTFPLIALTGAMPMLLFDITGPALLVACFFAVTAVTVISYVRTSAGGDVGATTEISAFATFLLGVLAGAGYLQVAGAAGVGVAILLVAKPRMEAFSRALTPEELAATLELAVISVIVLPVLPNQDYGPWWVLNPFHIWLVVVLVSGLSFAGFVAMRLWGERQGLLIAAAVGALVSSTAVTVAMANRSLAGGHLGRPAASATVLASTIMGLRVAVLAGMVNLAVLPRLFPTIGAMTLVSLLAAWVINRRGTEITESADSSRLTNPFSLRAALAFGAVYASVLVGARAAQEHFGPRGIYVAALFSSIVDVDAITIALTRLGPGLDAWRAIAGAITLGLVMNTLVKLGIALAAGAPQFRRAVTLALGATALAGVLSGLSVYRWY
jgi:uncharacterized membrane protein (DUF4010 family)